MRNTLVDWFHDDIAWCLDEKCDRVDCFRNVANMRDPTGVHTFSMMRGTEYCPLNNTEKESGNNQYEKEV